MRDESRPHTTMRPSSSHMPPATSPHTRPSSARMPVVAHARLAAPSARTRSRATQSAPIPVPPEIRATERPRVLVVDDEPHNRTLVRAILGATCEVLEACDARAAYEVLSRHPIDIVLLDVMMPGENGIAACRKIKAGASEYLPVLLLSGLTDQEDKNSGLGAGADDFLTKPVDRRELRLRVAAFLKLRAQERKIREQLVSLEKLAALKDDLASLLVHDLRNPLMGVVGWLQVLKREGEGSQLEAIDAALSAAARVREAVDDILQIRALESGALRIAPKSVDVDALVSDALASISGAARERGLTCIRNTTGVVARIDASLVRRSLENLLANAIKHGPRHTPLEIETRTEGLDLCLSVSDYGRGVPAATKDTLFTKFGTLDPDAQRTRKGFGLGLYLVQLVAEAHGGTVAVRDRKGGGAIFELTLPGVVTP